VRRFSFDGVFAEGWAFYEEALLEREGQYRESLDGPYAVAQLERLRGARAAVDTGTAQGEVSRFGLGPGQAFDYAVGKTQIDELLALYKAKKGSALDLQQFHDDLLSHGSAPVSIIAKEMLAEWRLTCLNPVDRGIGWCYPERS
jgi:uncharacterized protein (DUF885 family)